MKVILIEDEALAAERLSDLILAYDSKIEIVSHLDSVESAVEWFEENEAPDLAFFDIQLADGLSFEIFEKGKVPCPVIFTTAFDEYALKAFKVNSIDYLLKPIDQEELTKAIEQFKEQYPITNPTQQVVLPDLSIFQQTMQMITRQYKTRFIIKSGSKLSSVPVEEVDFFYSEHKVTWLRNTSQKKYEVDYNLEQLEQLLDPKMFFRLNRKFITAYQAIENVTSFSNSRLKIQLKGQDKKEDILISREKVRAFKLWLDQ